MMSIEFNKVTWYSQVVAVVLALIIFGVAFYLGSHFTENKEIQIRAEDAQSTNDVQNSNEVDEYKGNSSVSIVDIHGNVLADFDTSNWLTYTSDTLGIQFKYPPEYEVLEEVPDYIFTSSKSAQLLVRVKGVETTGNTIVFYKVRSTLNKEVANRFSWRVVSLEHAITANYRGIGFVLWFFTGDVYSRWGTYLYTMWSPTNPADEGDVPMDVLIADIESGGEPNEKTTEELIMRTIVLKE